MKEEKIGEYETWLAKFGGYANSMTLRDYFAAKAMQGLLHGYNGAMWDTRAMEAYAVADALLKAREQ